MCSLAARAAYWKLTGQAKSLPRGPRRAMQAKYVPSSEGREASHSRGSYWSRGLRRVPGASQGWSSRHHRVRPTCRHLVWHSHRVSLHLLLPSISFLSGQLLKDAFYMQWTCYPSDEHKLNFKPTGDQRARFCVSSPKTFLNEAFGLAPWRRTDETLPPCPASKSTMRILLELLVMTA